MAISLTSPNPDNYYVGGGIVSVKMDDDDDYVDVGNVTSFQLSPNITRLDHFSSRGGIREKDASVITEVSATLDIVMEEYTARNLSLVLMGVPVLGAGTVTMDILAMGQRQGAVKFVGHNQIGPQWTFTYPRVNFSPGKTFQAITDAKWGAIEIQAEVLGTLNDDDDLIFGTASAAFPDAYAP